MSKVETSAPIKDDYAIKRNLVAKIKNLNSEKDKIEGVIKDFEECLECIKELPHKLNYDVMIPIGANAFFEGKLIRTNECMLRINEDLFVHRLFPNCETTLKNRLEFARSFLEEINQSLSVTSLQVDSLSENLTQPVDHKDIPKEGLVTHAPGGFMNIIERYESSEDEATDLKHSTKSTKELNRVTIKPITPKEHFNTKTIESIKETNVQSKQTSVLTQQPVPEKMSLFRQQMLQKKSA